MRAIDHAGNERVESVGFAGDSSGPQLTITSGPADDAIVTSATVTYGFTVSDASNPVSRTCKLDGGAAAACSSPKTFTGLSEGTHTFTLRATDGVGNATQVTREVFVNAVRPSVSITSGPSEGEVLRTRTATFGFTAAGGGSVSCSLDSETAFRACSAAGSDTLTDLTDGARTFRVRVPDGSDDVVVASRAFAVDTSVVPPPPVPIKEILNPSLSTGYSAFRTSGHGGRQAREVRQAEAAGRHHVTIRVTKAGAIGKKFVIEIRKGKAPKLTISQVA